MRINVYSQELIHDLEVVEQKTTGEDGRPIAYYGVRMYLASPDVLHHTPEDDDRSAITFWIPTARQFGPGELAEMFREMALMVEGCESVMSRKR